LAKSENQQIINLLTRINEIPETNSFARFKIIWAHFSNKVIYFFIFLDLS